MKSYMFALLFAGRFLSALRLVAALLLATTIPLVIDHRARRSTRVLR
jgi:hypothetical protein